MFPIWINGILGSLGILRYYRFFGLSTGPTYIHLRMISIVFIILSRPVGIGD